MFTRRRAAERSFAADGTAACPLCGTAVGIAADGRCRLGHQVVSEDVAARLLDAAEEDAAAAAPEPVREVEAASPPPPPLTPPTATLVPPPAADAVAKQPRETPAETASELMSAPDDTEQALAAALARLQEPAVESVRLAPAEPRTWDEPAPRADEPADVAEDGPVAALSAAVAPPAVDREASVRGSGPAAELAAPAIPVDADPADEADEVDAATRLQEAASWFADSGS